MSDILPWIVGLGVGGIVVEVIRAVYHRRNMGADYASVIASTAMQLLTPLELRIKHLEDELNDCKESCKRSAKEAEEAQRRATLAEAEARKYRRAFLLAAKRAGNEKSALEAASGRATTEQTLLNELGELGEDER